MASRRIKRQDLLAGTNEVGAGDGHDPRLDRPEDQPPAGKRKSLQLCGQVARTLAGVFAESGDEVLRDLMVESVAPAPSSARLLVVVTPTPGAPPLESARVLEHLEQARGRLRSEVAAAVRRRRAPDLTFRFATR
jgi:ribosome-binding factor A